MLPVVDNIVIITGTLGPDIDVTSLTFNFVTSVKYDFKARTIEITNEKNDNTRIQYFDYAITTTVTQTISGLVTTITIS